MKLRSLVLLTLIISMFTASSLAGLVSVGIVYDFSVDPACSATLTTKCVDHFESWDSAVGTGTLLGTFTAPSGANTSGVTVNAGLAFTITGYGLHQLYTVASAKDSLGNAVFSDPIQASFMVKPGAPKSVTLK